MAAAWGAGRLVGLVEEMQKGAGEAVAAVFGEGLRLQRGGLRGVLGEFLGFVPGGARLEAEEAVELVE